MSRLVESLKRLYAKGSISSQKLTGMKTSKKITQEEYDYITGKIKEEVKEEIINEGE